MRVIVRGRLVSILGLQRSCYLTLVQPNEDDITTSLRETDLEHNCWRSCACRLHSIKWGSNWSWFRQETGGNTWRGIYIWQERRSFALMRLEGVPASWCTRRALKISPSCGSSSVSPHSNAIYEGGLCLIQNPAWSDVLAFLCMREVECHRFGQPLRFHPW